MSIVLMDDSREKDKRKSLKDVVIIHGMFSNRLGMGRLAASLRNLECYGKVYCKNISSLAHRFVPKILQRTVEKEHVVDDLRRKIERGLLSRPFDVIGHSNGGYVALHLVDLLPANTIRNVFTVGTPRGIWELTPALNKVRAIVHITGGRDGIKKTLQSGLLPQEDGHPTATPLHFEFPDEGHCSIHTDAQHNGLADLISFVAMGNGSHTFVDENNVMHIWPWCDEDTACRRKIRHASELRSYNFTVCDGIHSSAFEQLKEASLSKDAGLVSRVVNLIKLQQQNHEIRRNIHVAISTARLEGKDFQEDLRHLQNDERKIRRLESRISEELERRQQQVLRTLRQHGSNLQDLLDMAEDISAKKGIGEIQLANVTLCLEEAWNMYSKVLDVAARPCLQSRKECA